MNKSFVKGLLVGILIMVSGLAVSEVLYKRGIPMEIRGNAHPVLSAGETVIVLRSPVISNAGKTFTVSTTNYVLLTETVPAGSTFISNIVVHGELQ